MVCELGVLLWIQNLQESGGRIPFEILSQLVNLVQQQQGIVYPGLFHRTDDAAGHGADIGTPVAHDFRLIADASQGNPHIFSAGSLCDGTGNGSFAHTGRSHQTDDLPCLLGGQALHGQNLQETLFDLFQAIVVPIENALGPN